MSEVKSIRRDKSTVIKEAAKFVEQELTNLLNGSDFSGSISIKFGVKSNNICSTSTSFDKSYLTRNSPIPKLETPK